MNTELERLRKEKIEVKNGCKVFPSEKSVAIAIGTALADKNTAQDTIGAMLSNPDILVDSVRESIADARCVFMRHLNNGENDDTSKETRMHPCFGKNLKEEAFAPFVKVADGRPTIFIPTDVIISTRARKYGRGRLNDTKVNQVQ